MRRMRTLLAVCTSVLLVVGCSTLPSNTDPQVLRSFEGAQPTQEIAGPEPGEDPDLLLRGFLTASAFPAQQYETARSYLTEGTRATWDPSVSTRVLDRVDLNTQPGSTAEERRIIMRGTEVGTLRSGGVYQPGNTELEMEITMRRENGEWRIDALPDGVLLERNELRNHYSPKDLYFFDPSGRVLVNDRRWIHSGVQSLNTVLMSLLVTGPSEGLSPGVVHQLPREATFVGFNDNQYQFAGLSDLDEQERLHLAAQIVWTLAMSEVTGPYTITADGAPLIADFPTLSLDDVAEYNPQAYNNTVSTLFALQNGVVSRVSSGALTPLAGSLGAGGVDSVAISTSADVAASVRGRGDQAVLTVGAPEGESTEVLLAESITRPTFEYGASGLWVVVDGDTPVRVARSSTTGELVQTESQLSLPDEVTGVISEFQLARTGVRAAMIIDGRVFIGVVTRPGPGERRVTNITEVAPVLAGSALSLAWHPDGALIVGTSIPELPIWRVEQDGSSSTALPSGNITAPVVSVASSATTLYATDTHAMLQLSISDNDIWREVPGLLGARAAPVVAY